MSDQLQPDPSAIVAAIRDRLRQKQYPEARQLCQQAVTGATRNPELLHLAAAAEMGMGRPELAIQFFERAQAQEPDNVAHSQGIAASCKALGRQADAIVALERALALAQKAALKLRPAELNLRVRSHHLQHRPINHVVFRRSRLVDEAVAGFVTAGDSDDLARAYFLIDNVARTLARGVQGVVVELGVWRGLTARLLQAVAPGRMLYLFDSFEPRPISGGRPASYYQGISLASARALLGEDEVVYCPGPFPAAIAGLPADLRLAVVHLNRSNGEEVHRDLEWAYPRLSSGGLLVIHEYASDARPDIGLAVDDFLIDKPEKPVIIPDRGGAGALVKV